jgi:hypothetical protein
MARALPEHPRLPCLASYFCFLLSSDRKQDRNEFSWILRVSLKI